MDTLGKLPEDTKVVGQGSYREEQEAKPGAANGQQPDMKASFASQVDDAGDSEEDDDGGHSLDDQDPNSREAKEKQDESKHPRLAPQKLDLLK